MSLRNQPNEGRKNADQDTSELFDLSTAKSVSGYDNLRALALATQMGLAAVTTADEEVLIKLLAVHSDEKLQEWIEKWKQSNGGDLLGSLNDVCKRLEIPPPMLYEDYEKLIEDIRQLDGKTVHNRGIPRVVCVSSMQEVEMAQLLNLPTRTSSCPNDGAKTPE